MRARDFARKATISLAILGLLGTGLAGPALAVGEPEATEETENYEPVTGDVPDPAYAPMTLSAPVAPASASNAAVTTNAINGAYIDVTDNKIFATTRSAVPATLFTKVGLGASGNKTSAKLPVGFGAWAVARSKNTIAVATVPSDVNSNDRFKRYPVVLKFDANTGKYITRTDPLPGAGQVYTIAEDQTFKEAGNEIFWVGAAATNGAPSLWRVDFGGGKRTATQIIAPPNGAWNKLTNIRSLSSSPDGLIVGLGSPVQIWKYTYTPDKKGKWQNITPNNLSDETGKASLAYSSAIGEIPASSSTAGAATPNADPNSEQPNTSAPSTDGTELDETASTEEGSKQNGAEGSAPGQDTPEQNGTDESGLAEKNPAEDTSGETDTSPTASTEESSPTTNDVELSGLEADGEDIQSTETQTDLDEAESTPETSEEDDASPDTPESVGTPESGQTGPEDSTDNVSDGVDGNAPGNETLAEDTDDSDAENGNTENELIGPASPGTPAEGDDPGVTPLAAGTPVAVVGTDLRAHITAINMNTNKVVSYYNMSSLGQGIDQVAIDNNSGTAWFTLRPFGSLWKWNLKKPNSKPVQVAVPIAGSETRGLTVKASADGKTVTIYGVSNTSDVWQVNGITGKVSSPYKLIKKAEELPENTPMGLINFGNRWLVGGHWRVQDGNTVAELPGEPKATVTVGNNLYAALYPQAAIYRLDSKLNSKKIADIPGMVLRPAALEYNPTTKRLLVAVGPKRGARQGSLTLVDPANGKTASYPSPVGKGHQVTRIAAYGDRYVIGTSTQGEEVPQNGKPMVALWTPSGRTWTATPVSSVSYITGLRVFTDRGGSYVLGTTSDGWVFTLDADTGRTIWIEKLGRSTANLPTTSPKDRTISIDGVIREFFPNRVGYQFGENLAAGVRYFAAKTDSAGRDYAYIRYEQRPPLFKGKSATKRSTFRLSGDERYQTAIAASQAAHKSSRTVYVARGDDFADALTVGPLAARDNAPVLLANSGTLTPETRAEISRLGATRVVVVGGQTSVPDDKLRASMPRGVTSIERVAGGDRYQTAVAVAERLRGNQARIPVMVTTGRVFADATTSVPAAHKVGAAILLSHGDTLTSETRAFIDAHSSQNHTVGGEAQRALGSAQLSITTASMGADRYETSTKVAANYFGKSTKAYVASGENYPDAVTGSVSSALDGAPLILSKKDELPGNVIASVRRGIGSSRLEILGGPNTVSNSVVSALRKA